MVYKIAGTSAALMKGIRTSTYQRLKIQQNMNTLTHSLSSNRIGKGNVQLKLTFMKAGLLVV